MKKLLIILGVLITMSVDVSAQQFIYRAYRACLAEYNAWTGEYEWGNVQNTNIEIKIFTDTDQLIILSKTPQLFNLVNSITTPFFPSLGYERNYEARDIDNVTCTVTFTHTNSGDYWIFITYSNVKFAYKLNL